MRPIPERDARKARAPARRGSTIGPRIRIAGFLAAGILLAGFGFYLLVGELRRPARVSDPGKPLPPGVSTAAVDPAEMPYGSPTDKDPFRWPDAPPPRHEGDFPRWNLKEFPPGWDPKTAHSIHDAFDAMVVDREDKEKFPGIEQARKDLDELLSKLGPEAVPTLAAILNAEGDFVDRRFIIRALGNLGPQTEEATYVLRDFFLSRHENDANRSELYHVIDAMGKLQNDTSFQTLADFTERPDLHSYRPKVIEALGEHPRREEAINTFVGILHDDEVTHARNKAAQALGKVKSESTLGELYAAFEKERYWVNKQTILGSIGKIGNPGSFGFLEDKARNAKEPAVRLSAGGALLKLPTPAAARTLRELARSEPDPQVRQRFERWAEGASRR